MQFFGTDFHKMTIRSSGIKSFMKSIAGIHLYIISHRLELISFSDNSIRIMLRRMVRSSWPPFLYRCNTMTLRLS